MDNISPDVQQKFEAFWQHMPLNSKDEVAIVLKGHLLIEDVLRDYCHRNVTHADTLRKAKLTFKQTLLLAKSFRHSHSPEWLWDLADRLNTLRNDLAHALSPAKYQERVAEFVRLAFANGKPSQELLSSFPEPPQKLALAIFLLHTHMTGDLSYKPHEALYEALVRHRAANAP